MWCVGPNRGVTRVFEAVAAGIADPVDLTYDASIPVHDSASGVPEGVSLVYAKYVGPASEAGILNIP